MKMFGCVVEVGIFFILILVNWLRWVWCGQCWAFSQRWNIGEGVFVIVWRIFEANLRPFKTKRPPTFSGINHLRPSFTLFLPFAFTHCCFVSLLKSMLLCRVFWFFGIDWFWGIGLFLCFVVEFFFFKKCCFAVCLIMVSDAWLSACFGLLFSVSLPFWIKICASGFL